MGSVIAMPDAPVAQPDDWTTVVADRIESVVGVVRDRTTTPILKVARIVVYGVLAVVAGIVALILLLIALIRLHVYLPFHPAGRQVWVSYGILSVLFLNAGFFLWKKRVPPKR
jgi:hypothetical protein